MSPRVDFVMECLPTCREVDRPPRYGPITCGEYVAWFTGQNYHGDDAAPAPR